MSGISFERRMFEAIANLGEAEPSQFADAAMATLAVALSKMPADEREDALLSIERGLLRVQVGRLPGAQAYPRMTNGAH